MNTKSIDDFVEKLKVRKSDETVFNMYENDTLAENLRLYLHAMEERKPAFFLVGEAPGPWGCRKSGVPFTAEYDLQNRQFFSSGEYSFNIPPEEENTARIVWDKFEAANFYPLLWNVFPFYPHKEGNPNELRKPTAKEQNEGKEYIDDLMKLFGIDYKNIYAVGRIAWKSLKQRNSINAIYIRHPSHGGKTKFCDGIDDILKKLANKQQ